MDYIVIVDFKTIKPFPIQILSLKIKSMMPFIIEEKTDGIQNCYCGCDKRRSILVHPYSGILSCVEKKCDKNPVYAHEIKCVSYFRGKFILDRYSMTIRQARDDAYSQQLHY